MVAKTGVYVLKPCRFWVFTVIVRFSHQVGDLTGINDMDCGVFVIDVADAIIREKGLDNFDVTQYCHDYWQQLLRRSIQLAAASPVLVKNWI